MLISKIKAYFLPEESMKLLSYRHIETFDKFIWGVGVGGGQKSHVVVPSYQSVVTYYFLSFRHA